MDFADEITHAAGLFEAGKLAEAAEIFKRLCEQEDASTPGRMIAAHNLAVTYDKMGHPDHAVATHEYGVGLVTSDYAFAQESRAEYLHRIGRIDDAIAVWQHLSTLEFLSEEKAARVRHNLAVARANRESTAT
jgi:hypothetical protein